MRRCGECAGARREVSFAPRLSVIIATRNRPELLAATLERLCAQSVPADEYEVVVVDDGSSPPLALPDAVGAAAIHLVRTVGVERSAARNAGVAAARGEWILFLDDDMAV